MEIGGDDGDNRPPGWRSVPLDPAAVTDALDEWPAEAVSHLQLLVLPSTRESYDVVLSALADRKSVPR